MWVKWQVTCSLKHTTSPTHTLHTQLGRDLRGGGTWFPSNTGKMVPGLWPWTKALIIWKGQWEILTVCVWVRAYECEHTMCLCTSPGATTAGWEAGRELSSWHLALHAPLTPQSFCHIHTHTHAHARAHARTHNDALWSISIKACPARTYICKCACVHPYTIPKAVILETVLACAGKMYASHLTVCCYSKKDFQSDPSPGNTSI